jgi:hypothetical protein
MKSICFYLETIDEIHHVTENEETELKYDEGNL